MPAILSHIETRQVANDYTIRLEGKLYQIARSDIGAGLRGGTVSVEQRLDGTLAVRFEDRYLSVAECAPQPKPVAPLKPARAPKKAHRKPSEASRQSLDKLLRPGGLPVWKAAQINRTRTQ